MTQGRVVRAWVKAPRGQRSVGARLDEQLTGRSSRCAPYRRAPKGFRAVHDEPPAYPGVRRASRSDRTPPGRTQRDGKTARVEAALPRWLCVSWSPSTATPAKCSATVIRHRDRRAWNAPPTPVDRSSAWFLCDRANVSLAEVRQRAVGDFDAGRQPSRVEGGLQPRRRPFPAAEHRAAAAPTTACGSGRPLPYVPSSAAVRHRCSQSAERASGQWQSSVSVK